MQEDILKSRAKTYINEIFGNLLNRSIDIVQVQAEPENVIADTLVNNQNLLERAKQKILWDKDIRHLVKSVVSKNCRPALEETLRLKETMKKAKQSKKKKTT